MDSIATCTDDACRSSQLSQSKVLCEKESCVHMRAFRSTVTCEQGSCFFSTGAFSAITCDSSSCFNLHLYEHCTCCDGNGCPMDALSCEEDRDAFCSSMYLGRTCKEWGNPVCVDVPVEPVSSSSIIDCEKNDCFHATFENEVVFCNEFPISGYNKGCSKAAFRNSTVLCLFNACNEASFVGSTADCFQSSCFRSSIRASAFTCNLGCQGRGRGPSWDRCSCCDGKSCGSVPGRSCIQESQYWCGFVESGVTTCAERGLPCCRYQTNLSLPPNAEHVVGILPDFSPSSIRLSMDRTTVFSISQELNIVFRDQGGGSDHRWHSTDNRAKCSTSHE